MSNKKAQIMTMIVLALIMVLCIPSSFAKYTTSARFTVPVKVEYDIEEPITSNTFVFTIIHKTDSSGTRGETKGWVKFTTPKNGDYAIIVKGGNGVERYRINRSISGNNDPMNDATLGGLVATKVNLSSGKSINVAIGSAGEKPSISIEYGTGGSGGRNAANFAYGGDGKHHEGVTSATSGGAGAGTIVLLDSETVTMDNLIAIAAGGGSGGSWDAAKVGAIASVKGEAGAGGNAGSQYGSNATSTQSVANYGTVYTGISGGGNDSFKGLGAGVNPGSGKGTAGSAFANGGHGGNAANDTCVGAGGGGYSGGAAGKAATKSSEASGGGGGGSSYLATTKFNATSLTSEIYNRIQNVSGFDTSIDGGMVAIAYLLELNVPETNGETDSAVCAALIQNVIDIYNEYYPNSSGDSIDNTDTTNKVVKTFNSNSTVSSFLGYRNWKITKSGGVVTFYFTNEKTTGTVTTETTDRYYIWKYSNGAFSKQLSFQPPTVTQEWYRSGLSYKQRDVYTYPNRITNGVIQEGVVTDWENVSEYPGVIF